MIYFFLAPAVIATTTAATNKVLLACPQVFNRSQQIQHFKLLKAEESNPSHDCLPLNSSHFLQLLNDHNSSLQCRTPSASPLTTTTSPLPSSSSSLHKSYLLCSCAKDQTKNALPIQSPSFSPRKRKCLPDQPPSRHGILHVSPPDFDSPDFDFDFDFDSPDFDFDFDSPDFDSIPHRRLSDGSSANESSATLSNLTLSPNNTTDSSLPSESTELAIDRSLPSQNTAESLSPSSSSSYAHADDSSGSLQTPKPYSDNLGMTTPSPTNSNLTSAASTAPAALPSTNNILGNLAGYINNLLQPEVASSALGGASSNPCDTREDCGEFEWCLSNSCVGFNADVADTYLIRCVEGYKCDVTPGTLAGTGVTTDFQVIGVSPAERCGLAQPLPARLSIFASSNRWRCEDVGADKDFCAFSPGVGMRRNKTLTLEGLRLCGCPAADTDENGVPCDTEADFFVPLAKLGVQECLTNAHCLHKTFAYCVHDHCAGFMGVAASAGLKAYQCLLNRSCSVPSLAAKALNEGLKVVPIATTFSCGAEQALDPDFFTETALPCVMDVNGDGNCDIHLGVARAIGTNRLCGCNGKDNGGNGRPCDELADFDTDLGTVTVDECVVDGDCQQGLCVASKCVRDSQEPYVVSIVPVNGSYVVPPVTSVKLIFNENIQFAKAGGRRFVLTTPTELIKFELPITDPTMSTSTDESHRVSIVGRELTIVPDIRMTTLPESTYLLGFEGGIVEDLQGNGNIGSTEFSFMVSSDAGCPLLGVTGFTVDNVNLNGVYRASTPLNSKARWVAVQGGSEAALANAIFWRGPTSKLAGRWVVGLSYDESKFLAFADDSGDGEASARPPYMSLWKRWKDSQWQTQGDVIVACPPSRIVSPPKIVWTEPRPGSRGVDIDNFTLVFQFDRPMTFGHWSTLVIADDHNEHRIVVDPEASSVRNSVILRDLQSFRMTVIPPEDLRPGTNYSVTLETGVFTDLQYNPSPLVTDQELTFTTFGASCPAYVVSGHVEIAEESASAKSAAAHGSSIKIRCKENYAPKLYNYERAKYADRLSFGTTYPKSSQTEVTVNCYDGEWDFYDLQCRATCRQYSAMGKQYELSVVHAATDDGLIPFDWDLQLALNYSFMKDGSQVRVKCSESSEAISGSPLGETTTCQDGRWTDVSLRCGQTCGAFPSLGPAYKFLDTNGSSVKIGSHRTIACNSDTGVSGQEDIHCSESGWGACSLSCHYNCSPLDEDGIFIQSGLTKSPSSSNNNTTLGMNVHGKYYIMHCGEDDTIPTLAAETEERGEYETSFWTKILANITLQDNQVAVACFEGAWQKSRPLTCDKRCAPFTLPGPGYESQLVLGDGVTPGTTFKIGCKGDAVSQYKADASDTVDTVVCLSRGEWVRLSYNVACFGACPHPVLFFGSNYRVITEDGGQLPPPSTRGLSYRHHSQTFRIECNAGSQPLSAPPDSTPTLQYQLVNSNLVQPVPTLFEHPSQIVTCDDGRWQPASQLLPDIEGAALRCVPFCPRFTNPSSMRYYLDVSKSERGLGWASKRTLACQPAFKGAVAYRDADSLSIRVVERRKATFVCYYGMWTTELLSNTTLQAYAIATTLANESHVVGRTYAASPFSLDFRSTVAQVLPCGSGCQKKDLEAILTRHHLRIAKPSSKSKLPRLSEHSVVVEVTCEKSYSRLSGPSSDQLICFDGAWSQPLLVCGKQTCGNTCANACDDTQCPELSTCGDNCAGCGDLPTNLTSVNTMILTLESEDGRALRLNEDIPSATPHGTIIHAHLNESFVLPASVTSSTHLTLRCLNGNWRFFSNMSFGGLPQMPNCDDMKMGRGEWGKDCGGFCPQACPDCSDGVRNGNEVWIDCGGQCAACQSCSHAEFKRFRSSSYVVQTVSLPTLDIMSTHNAYDPTQVRVTGVIDSSVSDESKSSPQGSQRRVICGSGSKESIGSPPLDVVCLNGRWWPMQTAVHIINNADDPSGMNRTGSNALLASAFSNFDLSELSIPAFSLTCETEEVVKLKDLAFHRFRPLPSTLTLSFCETVPNDAHFCCDLLHSFAEELGGECGAMIYGNQVEKFCKGLCKARLDQMTAFYDLRRQHILNSTASQMSRAHFADFTVCQTITSTIAQLSDLFCVTNADETTKRTDLSISSQLKNVKSDYCFSQASLSLSHIRNFDKFLRAEDLDIICDQNSCFKSNLNYFSLLYDLISNTQLQLSNRSSASSSRRRRRRVLRQMDLDDTSNYFGAGDDLPGTPDDFSGSLLSAAVPDFAEQVHGETEDALEDHIRDVLASLEDSSRRLSESVTTLLRMLSADTEARMEEAWKRRLSQPLVKDPNQLKFSKSVVNLMCLIDARGNPCAPFLHQIMAGFTQWTDRASLTKLQQQDLGAAVASLSSACSNTCFLQISRYLGQHLSIQGTYNADPYQRFFGVMLKLFGRYYCQHDSSGASCAIKFFGYLFQRLTGTNPATSTSSHAISSAVVQLQKALHSCDASECPRHYVYDGVCDTGCFTDTCGYDGRDCLIATMFGDVIEKLTLTLPLTDSCHPLNPDFKTCKKHGTCWTKTRDALLKDGCCHAVGVDILKELMDLEYFSHPMLRNAEDMVDLRNVVFPTSESKIVAEAGNFSLGVYENYRPDRSSLYSQVLCNLFVDRTCSRGLARRVVNLEFVIQSLSYDSVYWLAPVKLRAMVNVQDFPTSAINFNDFSDAVGTTAPYLRFALMMRKYLADLLALAIADFRDIRLWPDQKGTRVFITIDPGMFTDEILRTLQATNKTGELSQTIVDAFQQWRLSLPTILATFLDTMQSRSATTRRRLDAPTATATTATVAAATSAPAPAPARSTESSAESGEREALASEERKVVDSGVVRDLNGFGYSLLSESESILEAIGGLPVPTVSSIYYSTRSLDPIRAPISVAANYSGGDPLTPVLGSFDVGGLPLAAASCPLRFTYRAESGTLTNLSLREDYRLDVSLLNDAGDGQSLLLSCRQGKYPSASATTEEQTIICSNGQWVTSDRDQLLTCHKSCSEFSLVDNGDRIYQYSGTGLRHGATRIVTCSAGYTASSNGPAETLKCLDGIWQDVSLQCQKALAFDATCNSVELDPLAREYKFAMTSQMTYESTLKWWAARCRRGYQRSKGSEPLQIICLDDSAMYAFSSIPSHIAQLLVRLSTQSSLASTIDAAMRQWVADGSDFGQVATVDLNRLIWSTNLPLKDATGAADLSEDVNLECVEAVFQEPVLLTDTGIDDWTYIGVVAAIAVGFTGAFAAWGYYWQVYGRQRHQARKAAKLAEKVPLKKPPNADDEDDDDKNRFPSSQETDLPPPNGPVGNPLTTDESDMSGWQGGQNVTLRPTETISGPLFVSHYQTAGSNSQPIRPSSNLPSSSNALMPSRQRLESGSSYSFYSDLEFFAHQRTTLQEPQQPR